MSNRIPSRSRLSLLIAAALFGVGSIAGAQSTDPAEIPVDDVSVQADLDEDGLDDNDLNVDEEDEVALADEFDQDNDDLDVDGDFDPEVDPDVDAHSGASDVTSDDMAQDMAMEPMDADAELHVDAEPVVGVDGELDAELDPVAEHDHADTSAMGFESDSDIAASGSTGATTDEAGTDMDTSLGQSTTIDTTDASGAASQIEAGPPADAFAATAGTEGFSEGETAQDASQRFNTLDSDSSGSLSTEEVASVQPLQSSFGEYDLNDDGSIAENEFQSFFAATADVDSGVQTAEVGDGTLQQDATAASTEPATDTSIASESTGELAVDADDMDVDSDAADLTASTGTDATSDAAVEAGTGEVSTGTESTDVEATAATDAEVTTEVEATAATDGTLDYDAYEGSLTQGEEIEAEADPTVDEDDQ